MNITSFNTINQERIDDIPLLLTQLENMGVQKLLSGVFSYTWELERNKFGMGVSSVVKPYFVSTRPSFELCALSTGQSRRELDFYDDRLEASLKYLSQDKNWSEFECALGGNLVQVYDLSQEKIRLDSTTASSYCEGNEEGLFQWGYSKRLSSRLETSKNNALNIRSYRNACRHRSSSRQLILLMTLYIYPQSRELKKPSKNQDC